MDFSFTKFDKITANSGRDKSDLRLGDHLLDNSNEAQFVVLGYPDEEGIHLNGGRLGAKFGPDKARKYFYKMTADGFQSAQPKVFDAGNLDVDKFEHIADRHQTAENYVSHFLTTHKKVISLGGGHDYGYPDGNAYLHYCEKVSQTKPLIINIDAHLDVRPTDKGLSSGTPFYRLLNQNSDIDFFQVGIQPQCNSKAHIDWCRSKGGKILSFEEILLSGESFAITASQFLGSHLIKSRPCFLSIDIDAFSSSFAMGCSQSWPTGLSPNEFFPWMDILMKRLQIVNLGIYELSPPLDLDDRTSKLVSQIMYRYIHHDL